MCCHRARRDKGNVGYCFPAVCPYPRVTDSLCTRIRIRKSFTSVYHIGYIGFVTIKLCAMYHVYSACTFDGWGQLIAAGGRENMADLFGQTWDVGRGTGDSGLSPALSCSVNVCSGILIDGVASFFRSNCLVNPISHLINFS